MNQKTRVAIFASGRGSNAQKIVECSKHEHSNFEVACILSNRKNAGVLDFARDHGIKCKFIPKKIFSSDYLLLEYLFDQKIDLIVLAGFLKLIPKFLVHAYPKRIMNIHPALLPKYGGKGMYGHHVHKAVYDAKESHSGMTIHYVNEMYDKGEIIFQIARKISADDTPDDIAQKVLELEHQFYPKLVDGVAWKISQNHS